MVVAEARARASGRISIVVEAQSGPGAVRRITEIAVINKVTIELGNTAPVIIAEDADLEFVARRFSDTL